jgi:hypothetical protein
MVSWWSAVRLQLASKKQLRKIREVVHNADGTVQQITGVDKVRAHICALKGPFSFQLSANKQHGAPQYRF